MSFVADKGLELYHHLAIFYPKDMLKPCTVLPLPCSQALICGKIGFFDLCIAAPVRHANLYARFKEGVSLLSTQKGETHHGPMRAHLFNGSFMTEGPNNMYSQALRQDLLCSQVLPAMAAEEWKQLQSYRRKKKEGDNTGADSTETERAKETGCRTCGIALPLNLILATAPERPLPAFQQQSVMSEEQEHYQNYVISCWDESEEVLLGILGQERERAAEAAELQPFIFEGK